MDPGQGPVRWAATVLVLFALATFLVVGFSEGGSAQAQPTTSEPATSETTGPDTSTPESTTPQSTTPQSTTPPGPILAIKGNGALAIVGLAGLLIISLWCVPLVFDLRRAYQSQTRCLGYADGGGPTGRRRR